LRKKTNKNENKLKKRNGFCVSLSFTKLISKRSGFEAPDRSFLQLIAEIFSGFFFLKFTTLLADLLLELVFFDLFFQLEGAVFFLLKIFSYNKVCRTVFTQTPLSFVSDKAVMSCIVFLLFYTLLRLLLPKTSSSLPTQLPDYINNADNMRLMRQHDTVQLIKHKSQSSVTTLSVNSVARTMKIHTNCDATACLAFLKNQPYCDILSLRPNRCHFSSNNDR